MENFLFFAKKFIPRPLFKLLRPVYHWLLALSAAVYYGFPARNLKVVGVTGTNGKTTVVALLHHIFEKSGRGVASISSLRFRMGTEETKNELKMTMPGRFFMQKFLSQALCQGINYVILEVTSEGIKQYRHKFIKFSGAVLTNVTPEHIESHGGFYKYLAAKLKLFQNLKPDSVAVLNHDDPNFSKFFFATKSEKVIYGRDGVELGGVTQKLEHFSSGRDGLNFWLAGVEFRSSLGGEFNLYNILAAVSLAESFGISLGKISLALSSFKGVPGRLEFVQREPFAVVIDYAHTPDSLRKVYETIRKLGSSLDHQRHNLICVLGAAGGGRDRWKRPEFGKIAAEFCDKIILTNEDPYDEDPLEILKEIERGLGQTGHAEYKKILDRREAIREALRLASAGDTVIITGKGAEPWIMGPRNTKIPWDDKTVVAEELGDRNTA